MEQDPLPIICTPILRRTPVYEDLSNRRRGDGGWVVGGLLSVTCNRIISEVYFFCKPKQMTPPTGMKDLEFDFRFPTHPQSINILSLSKSSVSQNPNSHVGVVFGAFRAS